MKKVLLVGLLFLESCKSTKPVHRFAVSAGHGTAEIRRFSWSWIARYQLRKTPIPSTDTGTVIPAEIHCSGAGYGEIFQQPDSLLSWMTQTLICYFSYLQKSPGKDSGLQKEAARLLRSTAGSALPATGIVVNDEKISATRHLLGSILNKPKKNRYRDLVTFLQQNDSSVATLLSTYVQWLDSFMLFVVSRDEKQDDSLYQSSGLRKVPSPGDQEPAPRSNDRDFFGVENQKAEVRESVALLHLIGKDHHMLAYGTPPPGYAYGDAKTELKQDIWMLGQLTVELRRRSP
jgi:hypothetical protein